jgi:hypothetical protein
MRYRKGPGMEAKLCFIGHALIENRQGLFVDTRLTKVSGHAERLAALDMIEPRTNKPKALTLEGDKGFDAAWRGSGMPFGCRGCHSPSLCDYGLELLR